jgi:photosystem II stability/assembly factor-like uncharacterized protein
VRMRRVARKRIFIGLHSVVMRYLILFVLSAIATAQTRPQLQISNTQESLRGVSAISRQIAWASGTHGTYLRTLDGGRTWTPAQVPDADKLDFRGVVAFSTEEAFLMSAGPGDQSRIYHTTDGGAHWQLQFTNTNPKGFFDSIAFWDAKHGVAVGDPVADETGKLKFEVLLTDDGQTWHAVEPSKLPVAMEGEGAFAASNTCIAILSNSWLSTFITVPSPSPGPSDAEPIDSNIWFATGGKVARVFHSPDHGQTWEVFDTPVIHGPDSAGIFSIAFRDANTGVIAGGDYKRPNDDGPNLAVTHDGGKTWELTGMHPLAYFSGAAFDHKVNIAARQEQREEMRAELGGKKQRIKPELPERLFLVGQDLIFDFDPPANPHRINIKKSWKMKFNAASPYPEGGALIVGAKGAIIFVP